MPLLYKTPTGEYALISEAGLHGEYCGAGPSSGNPETAASTLYSPTSRDLLSTPPPRLRPRGVSPSSAPVQTLLKNTMAENLSPANVLEDTSWIQPGVTCLDMVRTRESTSEPGRL